MPLKLRVTEDALKLIPVVLYIRKDGGDWNRCELQFEQDRGCWNGRAGLPTNGEPELGDIFELSYSPTCSLNNASLSVWSDPEAFPRYYEGLIQFDIPPWGLELFETTFVAHQTGNKDKPGETEEIVIGIRSDPMPVYNPNLADSRK